MKRTLPHHYRWHIVALCAIMFIISQFWRVSIAVIAGELSHDLGLSSENLGLLGAAFFYSFGLAQLPMGPLLDRFGARVVMSALACIGATCAIVFALSNSGTTAILARAGIGAGMAAALMGSYKIFTTWFSPDKFATLTGIMISIGNTGIIVATTPLAILSETFGWRGAFLCMAAITMLIAIVFYLVIRDHPPQQAGSLPPAGHSVNHIFSGFSTVFGNSLFWRLAPLMFASYGTLITVQGLWGGPYLIHTYGMTKAAAGNILLAIPIGVICGAPLWGRWSDKLARRKMPILLGQCASLLFFSGLAVNLQLPHWGLWLQFWLFGVTGVSSTLLYVQVKETFPLFIAGTALTSLNFFLILGAAVFQHMMGIIMGHWPQSMTGTSPVIAYQWGFGVCAALLALTLMVYAGSRDTGPASASL